MADETKTEAVSVKPKRRWYRFSLRSLMVLVIVLAVPIGWVAKERRQSGIEIQIAEHLRQQGVRQVFQCGQFDSYELMQSNQPQGWWRNAARIVLGERVFTITIKDPNFSDLTPLVGLATLERLDVSNTQVSDLSPLAGSTNLKQLYVSATLVSDLAPIKTLERLQTLDVGDTQVTDLSPLAKLTQLTRVEFDGTRVKDASPLVGLTRLQYVSFDNADVFDLTPLAGLTNLQQVNMRDALAANNKEQVAKLQQALPNCIITK